MAKTASGKASLKRTDQRLLKRAEETAKKNGQFTPEALAYLETLEEQAQQEANSNPDLKLQFTAVNDFLQQWALLKPEEQKRLGDQFQERANALVDVPFDQQLTDLRSGLGRQLKALNTKYQFLTQDEEAKMATQLADLDSDVVQALTSAFTSIEERGLGNSGALRAAADAIMSEKTNITGKLEAARQLNLNQGNEILKQGTEEATANNTIDERKVQQERTVAREEKKNDLVGAAVQKDILQQIISGAGELTPRDVGTFTPSALNPDTLPTPESAPTSKVADIPPAARIRQVRLGLAGKDAPTAPAPAAPSLPAPAAPVNNASQAAAEERRAIRLRRINSSF